MLNLRDYQAFSRHLPGWVRLYRVTACESCGEPTAGASTAQVELTRSLANAIEHLRMADLTGREPPEEYWSDELGHSACEHCCVDAKSDPGWTPPKQEAS